MNKACVECDAEFTGRREARYCSLSCAAKNRVRMGVNGRPRTRLAEHKGIKRYHREHAAPGLDVRQRTDLLHAWRKAGRTCAYCDGSCDTVDHIVPLVRGGTNYEGNLTPCCRRCNGSKGARTIVEWKHHKPAAQFNDTRPWMVDLPPVIVRTRTPKVYVMPTSHPCRVCGQVTQRSVYCCNACAYEGNARDSRERYRAATGLEPTWGRPVDRRVA